MITRGLRASVLAAIGAVALAIVGDPTWAELAPGTVINKGNADQVKDLVSPGIMWCIEHGLVLKIAPYKKIEWNPPYKEATEKYAGQVKLAADGRSIQGHVAGMPFPKADAKDPQGAPKKLYNSEYKPFIPDGQDLRNFDPDPGTVSDKPLDVERHYILDHLRTLF